MHANLNKTASKTLLLLLPKDEEGKARKPRTFLHNLLKIRGAQTMAAVRNEMCWDGLGGWPRSTQSGKTAWNVFLFCRAQCTLQLPSPAAPLRCGCLPACPRHYPLACVHLFFICMNFSLFSQTQSANGANCTSRSAGSAQTRDICQWEISSKINLQHRQKQCPSTPLPRLLSVLAVLSCRIETSTMWHRPRCIPKAFALAKLGIQTNILLL